MTDIRGRGYIMRRIVTIGMGIIMLLNIMAQAQQPPVDASDTFVSEAGETCPLFAVEFQLSGKTATIALGGGRSIVIFPAFAVTMTNLETGTQITLSATGSFHQTTLANGQLEIVYTGRNLILDPEAGFVLAIGTFRAVYEGNIAVIPLSGKGTLTDVCELLA